MKTCKQLSFKNLSTLVRKHFKYLSDCRTRQNPSNYPIVDVAMSAFAMFHFQDSSLLKFQKALEDNERRSNLSTLFEVTQVPKSSQMRTLLDAIPSQEISEVFDKLFCQIDKSKLLTKFRFLSGRYLFLLDGSEYFSSKKCHCSSCLHSVTRDGEPRYYHKILQVALGKPGLKQVIPVTAEEVRNSDGNDKQDCELNASKRLIPNLRKAHPHIDAVIIADSLYSQIPFVRLLKKNDFSFILVAKSGNHKALYEDLEGLRRSNAIIKIIKKEGGRKHIYEFCNSVELRNDGAEKVNWFSYQLVNKNGKITYTNAWVTDISITKRNVIDLVKAGRCRWKIENENFNTLKNNGYNIKHNYGHGKRNLSFNLFLINLLAFAIHQILEIKDTKFQQVYQKLGSRTELWANIRALVNMLVFENWDDLILFMLDKKFRYSYFST